MNLSHLSNLPSHLHKWVYLATALLIPGVLLTFFAGSQLPIEIFSTKMPQEVTLQELNEKRPFNFYLTITQAELDFSSYLIAEKNGRPVYHYVPLKEKKSNTPQPTIAIIRLKPKDFGLSHRPLNGITGLKLSWFDIPYELKKALIEKYGKPLANRMIILDYEAKPWGNVYLPAIGLIAGLMLIGMSIQVMLKARKEYKQFRKTLPTSEEKITFP